MPEHIDPTVRALVHEVYARYSQAFDGGDVDKCSTLFTEDAVFTSGANTSIAGKPAIEDFLHLATERSTGMHHFVSNIVLDGRRDDQVIDGSATVLALRVAAGALTLAALGRYRDELVMDGGAWRFRSRTIETSIGPELKGALVAGSR